MYYVLPHGKERGRDLLLLLPEFCLVEVVVASVGPHTPVSLVEFTWLVCVCGTCYIPVVWRMFGFLMMICSSDSHWTIHNGRHRLLIARTIVGTHTHTHTHTHTYHPSVCTSIYCFKSSRLSYVLVLCMFDLCVVFPCFKESQFTIHFYVSFQNLKYVCG